MRPNLRTKTVTVPAGQTIPVEAFGDCVTIRNATADFELSFDGEHFAPMCAGGRLSTKATFDKLTLKHPGAAAITVILAFGQVAIDDTIGALVAINETLFATNERLLAIQAELKTRRYVDLPAGAIKALATGTNYSGTINANTTFTLPTISDGTPHEIWLSLTITGTPAINLGATVWFTAAQTLTAGNWRIGWIWEQSAAKWTVGAIPIITA